MAGLSKDKRTGIYVLQFYDPLCAPARKRVPTGVRDSRSAERLRRFWEAEYAEGRWDPWTQPPPVPGDKRQRTPVSRLTLDEARSLFLTSRAHRAANTYANYDRVTGWLMAYVGGNRPIASLEASDVQTWIDGLSVRPRTRANYV
ncbi:MAG TPA: hypothetical protein VK610_02240, partial [Rhodothermales bacterium]|nr:hypothetical protein [Rhodothermales bacterium]